MGVRGKGGGWGGSLIGKHFADTIFLFFSSFVVLVMISWHQQHIIHGVDWKMKMVYTIGETIDLHLSHQSKGSRMLRG